MGREMQSTFPTQIAAYLETHFPDGKIPSILLDHVGVLAGFCDLYERLPNELIRLPPQEYAALVAAVGNLKFRLEQFKATRGADSLNGAFISLKTAWEHIRKLKDQVPLTTTDLSFISDQSHQDMIGIDLFAINTALQSGEWKGATVLAGSCCEALLLYGLQSYESNRPGKIKEIINSPNWGRKSPNSDDLTDKSWDLFSYTEVAFKLELIAPATKNELGCARDYRNLIHPAKAIREKLKCDRGTAYLAVGALEHVISDLKKNINGV